MRWFLALCLLVLIGGILVVAIHNSWRDLERIAVYVETLLRGL